MSNNQFHENDLTVILGFKEWNSISESIEISHIFMIQSFITSNYIGKEIGMFLFDTNNDVVSFIMNLFRISLLV